MASCSVNMSQRWLVCRLRDAEVWARIDESDAFLAEGGRVEVVYQPKADAKRYRASIGNLVRGAEIREFGEADAAPVTTSKGAAVASDVAEAAAARDAGDVIAVWTDGACSGNPGPSGAGVLLIDNGTRRELSEYLGDGTNNIAELTAILRGLSMVDPGQRQRHVVVYTDSSYSIGVLSKPWKPKKNIELIAQIRELIKTFRHVRFHKVAGHSGIPENERTDVLATTAISRRRTEAT